MQLCHIMWTSHKILLIQKTQNIECAVVNILRFEEKMQNIDFFFNYLELHFLSNSFFLCSINFYVQLKKVIRTIYPNWKNQLGGVNILVIFYYVSNYIILFHLRITWIKYKRKLIKYFLFFLNTFFLNELNI